MHDDNSAPDAFAEPKIFSAVITPHRSLGKTGFLVLMLCIGGVSFARAYCSWSSAPGRYSASSGSTSC